MTKMLTSLALVLILSSSAQAFDRHTEYASLEPARAVKHKIRHRVAPDPQTYSVAYSGLVERARAYMGQTASQLGLRRTAWCAAFMNFVLKRTGRPVTGSDLAVSFSTYGRAIPGPKFGAIAILKRGKTGGHVGVVVGVNKSGDPIIISGNHNRAVGIGIYPSRRVLAYREI